MRREGEASPISGKEERPPFLGRKFFPRKGKRDEDVLSRRRTPKRSLSLRQRGKKSFSSSRKGRKEVEGTREKKRGGAPLPGGESL